MSSRTVFLCKLIGLYCVLASVAMTLHKEASLDRITDAVHSPGMTLVLAIVLVLSGLALVLCHNIWSGGIAAILVTLIGWGTLLKGLVFLYLSPEGVVRYWQAFHYEHCFYVYMGITFIIGAYLTIAGFRSTTH